MLFSLDVLRARKGDCLVLHAGTKDDPYLIMIDGGPSKVYKPHLRPRLEKIREARGIDEAEPLPVDVVMVSHVDDDHIKGILDLTDELREQVGALAPGLIEVASLWHNSFDDFLETTPDQLVAATGFGEATLNGRIETEADEELDLAMVLASIPQGRDLRDAAELLEWRINDAFGGKLILAEDDSRPVTLDRGLRMTVVGPMRPELVALQEKHDKWLREHEEEIGVSVETVPAAYVDESVPNLSSLVLLLEGDGRRMLLTGDARGDKILEGLELVGLLQGGGDSMHVNLLKVPHHGSANNVEVVFFQRITADHYVFSGNGQHGNPERETLEMLFDARGSEPFTIHLTYPIAEIDAERERDWEKAQRREKKRRDKKRTEAEKAKVKVRPDWSSVEHSLAGLLEQRPLEAGQTIAIVGTATAHVIDLGDPLGEAWPTLVD